LTLTTNYSGSVKQRPLRMPATITGQGFAVSSNLLLDPTNGKASKRLERFLGKALNLTNKTVGRSPDRLKQNPNIIRVLFCFYVIMLATTLAFNIMTIIPEFIRTEQNGIEYFKIVATGECGMSQSGLARACGVSRQSIIKLVDDLNPVTKSPSESLEPLQDKGLNPVTKSPSESLKDLSWKAPSEWLEPFIGKDLHLSGNFKKGGDAVVYRADFCSAVIGHYAGKGHAKALKVLMATTAIGLTSYIQGVTGWLPIALQSSLESRTKLDRIL